MSTHARILIALIVVLELLLGLVAGGYFWFRSAYIKVDGILYEKDLPSLDLRGQDVSMEHFQHLRESLPNCLIYWEIPFGDTSYPEDTTEIRVSSLTEEEVDQLQYFRNLQRVDATDCRDYEMISLIQQDYPQIHVDYVVEIDGQTLAPDTESLEFSEGRGEFGELMANLRYLPRMKTIYFDEPGIPAEGLESLMKEYPEIRMSWDKTVFGQRLPSDTRELDISGMKFKTVKEIEDQANYLTGLEKLIMCDTRLDNEQIAAFRARSRDKYQVIWNVQVGAAQLRTDQKGFIPSNFNLRVTNKDTENLKYCEGLLAVDFGHISVSELSWVSGTPHLKYLILGDGDVQNEDLAPLAQLKELEYLEIFMSPVTDISPLAGLTSLRDLNLSRSYVDVGPLGKMPWLRNLWLENNKLNQAEKKYLYENLPNTNIDWTNDPTCHGKGWRRMPSYYDMRDLLGMWYM